MRRRAMSVIVVMLVAAGSVLGAFQPPPSAQGSGDFVPVSSVAATDQLPAAPFLIGAYVVVWLALLIYVWSIWRRMKQLECDLADLRKRVQTR